MDLKDALRAARDGSAPAALKADRFLCRVCEMALDGYGLALEHRRVPGPATLAVICWTCARQIAKGVRASE